ncbi:MAG: immunoglobulin domain-containing protein, partial [Verrucomicrobiota bacterium]
MTIKLKARFVRARVLLLCGAFGAGLAQTGWAVSSGVVITNYYTLSSAVTQGGVNVFGTNVTVDLSNEPELEISTDVVLDGATNAATITRLSGAGRIFFIHTNASLTLLNLTISGGLSTNGGAIFNAGTLLVSNCVFSGNSATNLAGAAGANGVSGGNDNGGGGGDGASAAAGAVYSRGTLRVYLSVFNNNSVKAGDGGNGGNGVADFVFGGNGGNGGNGGGAQGGAVVCAGASNLFFATEFTGNSCAAGSGGSAGSAATGRFSGQNGSSGVGGGASGGAVLASGPLSMTNCLFSGNSLSGGGASASVGSGGSAYGGGLDLSSSATPACIENTTFFQNSCVGGAGGGAVAGGGLASSAALARLLNCTLAANTLTPGVAAGGAVGAGDGSDLARFAGVLKLGNSILDSGASTTVTNVGSTNSSTTTPPNCSGGLTDLGYNISSDASAAFTQATSAKNVDPMLSSGLSNPGNTAVGLVGGATMPTLAVSADSPAIGVIPGIPGLSFPATDQVLNPRISPTCVGAYEYNYASFTTNGVAPVILTGPTNQLATVGGAAEFDVLATNDSGGDNLAYQWQFNGTNLSEGRNVIGACSNILTLTNLQSANAGSYVVLVGNSTLTGVASSAPPALLTIEIPPRIQVQPPKTLKALVGSIATLSVKVANSASLSFQWVRDGTNLLDGDEISGATNDVLTINPVLPEDAGDYYVIVANDLASNNSLTTKLTVEPDTMNPTVSILLPAAGARTTNPALKGTARDDARVTNVVYWLTNLFTGSYSSGWATLAPGTAGASNWSIPGVPLPGANILAVQSVNFSSRVSKVVSRAFFYEVPAQLTVTNSGTGNGAVFLTGTTRLADGAMLDIGAGCSITAKPDKFSLFSNWVGAAGVLSDSPALKFIMISNLVLVANFDTNFFLAAAGTYNGLFFPTNADSPVAEENSGMLKNLVLKNTGACSGALLFDGKSYPVTAHFDVTGHAAFKAGELRVDLTLDSATPRITGTVSNTQWTASLTADLASKSPPSAESTILFSPSADVTPNSPPGDGYALVTNHSGMVTLGGALADGTSYSQAV